MKIIRYISAACILGGIFPGCGEGESYFKTQFGLTLDQIYWGEFHDHTLYSGDAKYCIVNGEPARLPAGAYAYARDEADLDFVGLSDHAEQLNLEVLPPEDPDPWQSLLRIGREYNNEDSANGKIFIVFPGWEYTNTDSGPEHEFGSETGYGHKNVVFKSFDHVPSTRYAAWTFPDALWDPPDPDDIAEDAAALWERLVEYRPQCDGCEGDAVTIVHTPCMGGIYNSNHSTDWDFMDADFVRNVELVSKWGNSEGLSPEEANCIQEDEPFEHPGERIIVEKTVRSILSRRWIEEGDELFLLSFLGGTDDHSGRPGNPDLNILTMPHRGAITGIAAPALTRDDLWTALWNRHTLAASTGEPKIPLLLAVETGGQHLLMGDLGSHDGTARVRVTADGVVEEIELVVDSCLFRSIGENTADETIPLGPGRHYIYARAVVREVGGGTRKAWTSPVYLDVPD